jgi:oligopeptide transport system permease protein
MKPNEYKISSEKFNFVNNSDKIRDKELSTKPVSYIKDAFSRFKRNKASILAAIIIGVLILFAVIAPMISPYSVSYQDTYFAYALPKNQVFSDLGIGFWDGCTNKEYTKENYYYFYLMGEETGHYAIKDQEYKIVQRPNQKGKMTDYYKVRLDTYQKTGMIFMDLTKAQYLDLQKYQNETGIQVIYPITNTKLRPTAAQDQTNANYWYETKEVAGKTSIVFGKDNSVNDIYYKVWTQAEIDAYLATLPESSKDEIKFKQEMKDNLEQMLKVGDNYNSIRVEGDEAKYYYAIEKTNGYYCRVNYYEYFVYYHSYVLKDGIEEPSFLFGATNYGQDIFTCLSSGARFSFILAVIVSVVNLLVGAIYGAIEGYYGGKIDLIMERFVEILSAVPFMIVITLLKYHMKNSSQVLILFISFFLTGWIGMAGRTRMQFYRFKNQEYVLAARTLGATDKRIMFKHIFPNALGTLITSCVLVIPGVIFSETSLSYLGIINLNSGNMTSVGTMLANAQPFLVSYPHMIFFPAMFICLLMLSFNLFGNGLRDAFNPSLRGSED